MSPRHRSPLGGSSWLVRHGLKLLLVFLPFAPLASWLHWGGVATFVCSALAIVPLAGLMGEATETLADRLGSGVGALLNVTFGNAAELIIALFALSHGYQDVVKASITGSVIGNALLVLGLAIVAGGIGRERQRFERTTAATGSTLLVLAGIGLVVPATFHSAGVAAMARDAISAARVHRLEQGLSLHISVVLFAVYLLGLLFSLRTHRHLFAGTVPQRREHGGRGAASAHEHAPDAGPGSVRAAVLTLVGATALIAWMSELLVGAVQEASHTLGFSPVFVGVVVVAVIGNAAEHSTAVMAALRDRMDLALHIAVGSGIQIALFVAPILVFVSHAMRAGPMDLVFRPFEVVAVGIAVVLVHLVAEDGESHWLEGVFLLAVYLMLALAFYVLP